MMTYQINNGTRTTKTAREVRAELQSLIDNDIWAEVTMCISQFARPLIPEDAIELLKKYPRHKWDISVTTEV